MSENSLYRKYRPSKISDLVGQDHVKQYLTNAVKNNKLSHAYLLGGSRGVGKTSIARIMALISNCENGPNIDYDLNSPICRSIINGECPDVHEIDAASNSSVENMRDLRSLARSVPIMCRKRVFIIDEAAVALAKSMSVILKLLEEPSDHVMFILATTDPQNVLATIQSRCQRFMLKNISTKDISNRLEYICKEEKIQETDKNALDLIAKSGNGSLRDAISNLEIILSKTKSISIDEVKNYIKINRQDLFMQFLSESWKLEYSKTILMMKEEINKGTDPENLLMSLLENFHDMLLCKTLNNFDIVYVEESIKKNWISATNKIDIRLLKAIHKSLLSYCYGIRNAPKLDFVLDQAIIDIVDKFKEFKKLN